MRRRLICTCRDCHVYGCSIWCEFCASVNQLIDRRDHAARFGLRHIDDVKVDPAIL